jgi:ribosomal protein S20
VQPFISIHSSVGTPNGAGCSCRGDIIAAKDSQRKSNAGLTKRTQTNAFRRTMPRTLLEAFAAAYTIDAPANEQPIRTAFVTRSTSSKAMTSRPARMTEKAGVFVHYQLKLRYVRWKKKCRDQTREVL